MIEGKILSYGDDLKEVISIREKVFVQEMGIPKELEFDELDNEALHVLVYENECNVEKKNSVATGRIVYDGVKCEIGHIAVLKEFRNKEYGDFTVRMLINRAFTSGINEVYLCTNNNLIKFFQNIGFQLVDCNIQNNDDIKCNMVIKMNDVITNCRR